jgi:hypothetical protein
VVPADKRKQQQQIGFSTPGHPLSVALPELPDVVGIAKRLGAMPPQTNGFSYFSHRVQRKQAVGRQGLWRFCDECVRSTIRTHGYGKCDTSIEREAPGNRLRSKDE